MFINRKDESMPSKKLLKSNQELMKKWPVFVEKGELDREQMRTVIADSWIRSKNADVDPYGDSLQNELTPNQFKLISNKFTHILDTAKPFMETLYETVGEDGMVVRLTDANGYVIECFGHESVLQSHLKLHLHKGTNVREDVIGTNAIGISLKKGFPIQVLGAEHYRKCYHDWTTSAAPIRNENDEIVAVISMSGYYSLVHPHTLGMIMACALAIEHEMNLNKTNLNLERANEHLEAIMESIKEGIITINHKGIITDANYFALNFLRKKYDGFIGTHIEDITSKKVFKQMIAEEGGVEEKEVHFETKNGMKKSVIVNMIPVYSELNDIREFLITFRESKKVYSQANKIFGSKAIFTFDDILGDSNEVEEAVRIAKLVSNSDATILLDGESGTGKELFAQSIHNESARQNNSFIFINCGAIPRDLVASELFGYEEGAFTGARKGGHPGKFELADGGTLFLDEIGDMPLDTQANLLRVLETREVVRVGGHDVMHVDVRVIAASHKDLKKEVERGNFRSDLFYRLNVMPIHTPALRERRNDIPILVDHFYKQFSIHKDKILIDENFYHVMKEYHWPGNVRELQNVMQMVCNLVKPGEKLSSKHLPLYMKEKLSIEETTDHVVVKPLYLIEKESIEKALKIADGNLVQAAKLLEIGRSTLYRKIEKYNIEV